MKPIWQGAVSFGLVTIPIQLYATIKEHVLGFNILCKKCLSHLEYERWCPKCKKEIPWNETVKGLNLPNGKTFIINQEDLKKLKLEKTDSIDITEFVKADQIAPIYLKNHYYIIPLKKAEKSFYLLQKVLIEENKVAVGRFVMRNKEYACIIEPYEKTMLLTTLNYSYEIRPLAKFKLGNTPKIQASELKLAKLLVNKLTKKNFDMSEFKDTFAQKLKKKIEQNKMGKKIKTTEIKKTIIKKNKTLLDALKASIIAPASTTNPTARANK